jgi:hypothetical protein
MWAFSSYIDRQIILFAELYCFSQLTEIRFVHLDGETVRLSVLGVKAGMVAVWRVQRPFSAFPPNGDQPFDPSCGFRGMAISVPK